MSYNIVMFYRFYNESGHVESEERKVLINIVGSASRAMDMALNRAKRIVWQAERCKEVSAVRAVYEIKSGASVAMLQAVGTRYVMLLSYDMGGGTVIGSMSIESVSY